MFPKSKEVKSLVVDVNWIEIVLHIIHGLEHLHSKYSILHNDLKCDNIVLNSSTSSIQAVIIDYGKACEIKEEKLYKLSEGEKQQYARHHSHIAPGLRDGICRQSVSSDIILLFFRENHKSNK